MKLNDLPRSILELNPHLLEPDTPALTFDDVKPNKADKQAEKDLQRLCEQELSRRGIWFLHLSHRAREKVGCPDILACVNGLAVAIELKTATGRLSEEQKNTLEHMAANGWRTAVVRSFEQFVEALNNADKQTSRPLTIG